VSESLAKKVIDNRLEPTAACAPKLFQCCGYVFIQGQGRPHASKHSRQDALVTTIGRAQDSYDAAIGRPSDAGRHLDQAKPRSSDN
jgi:hypothetical protein